MYTDVRVLDLLYRQTAPETLLRNLRRSLGSGPSDFLRPKHPNGRHDDYLDIRRQVLGNRRHFLENAEAALHGYSEDEQSLLFDRLTHIDRLWQDRGLSAAGGFLAPVLEAANDYLTIFGGEPVCRAEQVLEWREAYLALGQDLFICAYLADQDRRQATDRRRFTWPVIVRIENEDLYTLLEAGIAENHNHLAGGTQSFQIAWCRLMNDPGALRDAKEFKHFRGSSLFPKMHRAGGEKSLTMFEQAELAALVRSILFRALHRDEFTMEASAGAAPCDGPDGRLYGDGPDRVLNSGGTSAPSSGGPMRRAPFDGRTAFVREYAQSFQWLNGLKDTVDCLRTKYGVRVPVLDDKNYCFDFCLDYALEGVYASSCLDSKLRVLVGERAFLYRCVRACFKAEAFTDFERALFYLYLVLMCNFRSEMIQNNGQVGFMNFFYYQDRKDDAWDLSPYFSEAVGLAINNRLHKEHIVSLEGRLVPKPVVATNIYKAIRYDLGKRFADCRGDAAWDPDNYRFDPELDEALFKDAPWYYIFHFVKMPDDRRLKTGAFALPECRHQSRREEARGQAQGLAAALRQSAYLRSRVRGLDAAADEVFCRPEVFACAFRYIDAVQKKWNAGRGTLLSDSPMRISKTYHVGEDFMDIAGGLRAIDEAIRFLHLGPHSRIGHALALGVAAELHYRTKHFESVLTKQERLDDLVWILYRGETLGVVPENARERVLMARLRSEAQALFRYIYGDAVIDENWDSDLRSYWCSMLLRGDDPSVYRSGTFRLDGLRCDEFDGCLLDEAVSELSYLRKDRQIAGLCYYYHYGVREGIRSKETCTVQADGDYIRLMGRLQDAMIRFVHDRELIIETNPSSNVLIGTFKDYRQHPVFRFNGRWLEKTGTLRSVPGSAGETGRPDTADGAGAAPWLNVCVNTDDLGVFDTTLEFEYALLYAALKARRDEGGEEYTYSNREIMDYLEDLRKQGLLAVFPSNR